MSRQFVVKDYRDARLSRRQHGRIFDDITARNIRFACGICCSTTR
jgi:hypothetical protein